MSEQNNSQRIGVMLPLVIAVSLCVGMIVGGEFLSPSRQGGGLALNTGKLEQVLNNIDQYYVDSIDSEVLTEKAIKAVIEDLDPHTYYIPKNDVDIVNSQLQDGFEGVGIEFRVFRDTVKVVSVLADGPSDKAGIRSGDKLVLVNGETVAGPGLDSDEVVKKLRGKRGTKVNIGIARKGSDNTLYFNVTRDKIPTHSVNAAYMVDEKTGYIKISRFGTNTYEEFKEELDKLMEEGMKQLVLDLRDNGGGYMGQAVQVVDALLPKDKLIVYTDGKGSAFDEHEYSKNDGYFVNQPVIVLINEHSASASEIVTGALQDHDRALVVGRRSFGKGLVQRQIRLQDNSLLRLTISRYYTPSGRCIQKPYKGVQSYEQELEERFMHGEYFVEDSVQVQDSLQYRTVGGRKVFGGGGILPDVFIGMDTTFYTNYYRDLLQKDVMRDFAIEYANEHRERLEGMGMKQFISDFELDNQMVKELLNNALENEVHFNKAEFALSRDRILRDTKETIGRVIWGDQAFFPVHNQGDPTFMQAVRMFGQAEALMGVTKTN
ncbi:S41 family peptidase [Limibacter armeniacum]|uniref:S41 family peptidase n=1 Tax=Limibacter armeniacum TaxID=466084 RepID=UPI002FE698AF